MAEIEVNVNYSTNALQGWEGAFGLLGVTHLYYYCLILNNATYLDQFNHLFTTNGGFLPIDLTEKLRLPEEDRFILDVHSLSPAVKAKGSSRNDKAAREASDVIKAIQDKLRAKTKGQPENKKLEEIRALPEVNQILLERIKSAPNISPPVQAALEVFVGFTCLTLLADVIENIEVIFRP